MSESATADTLSFGDLEKALSSIDIPPCPAIVMQVMAEAQKDDPNLKELARTISADVGMSALAIKLANSPLFRIGAPASSVIQALTRLGTQNVVCVVVGVALRNCMSGEPQAAQLENFWNRASTAATAAGLIARHHYGIPADLAYTYALFHDAAIPVLMRHFPDYTGIMDQAASQGRMLIEAETSHFPSSHPIVGALLVRNWGLPPAILQAVRFHHEADVYELPHNVLSSIGLTLVAVTHVAEHLLAEYHNEQDLEVGDHLFAKALAHLGIHAGDLEELREDLFAKLNEAGR